MSMMIMISIMMIMISIMMFMISIMMVMISIMLIMIIIMMIMISINASRLMVVGAWLLSLLLASPQVENSTFSNNFN